MKCFFWVTPTRKLYDLFWAIHGMKEQNPPDVVALSAKHEVVFLPPPPRRDILPLSASEERASRIVDYGAHFAVLGYCDIPSQGSENVEIDCEFLALAGGPRGLFVLAVFPGSRLSGGARRHPEHAPALRARSTTA